MCRFRIALQSLARLRPDVALSNGRDVSDSYWQTLESAYSGELALSAFEQWLYATPELESVVGSDVFLDLIGFDFHQANALHEVRKLILKAYAARRPGEIEFDMARRVATEFLAGRRDMWTTARTFAQLSLDGHESWVPREFVYVDSELDTFPAPAVRPLWDSAALSKLLKRQDPMLERYDRAIREAAKEVIVFLDARQSSSSL